MQSHTPHKWKLLHSPDTIAPQLTRHTAIYRHPYVYIFGGANTKNTVGDLFQFDTILLKWYKRTTTGDVPSERYGHSAVLWNNLMIIFGGYDGWINKETFALNLDTFSWKRFCSGPIILFGHSAVMYNEKMIVFGGSRGIYINNTFEFQPSLQKWREMYCKGDFPSNRCSHTACIYNESMYIFGGYNGNYVNDMYALNLKSKKWKKVLYRGQMAPSPRSGHCIIVNDDFLYLFGGRDAKYCNRLYQFQFRTFQWRLVETSESPGNRKGHSMLLVGNRIIVFGGEHRAEILGGVYELLLPVSDEKHKLFVALQKSIFEDVQFIVE